MNSCYTSKIYAKEILNNIKGKKIIISQRDKNLELMKKYDLLEDDVMNIINSLTINHFRRKIKTEDSKIKSDWLYEFKPVVDLYDVCNHYIDYLYVKICEIDEGIFVVSIHEDEI